ncbi:MAG: DUF5677 domain-containing protein [Ignavibacteriaceae bacterium]|nr:DUF5677 domain-containing protein [Ignavibacteriaceae bacterium]
MEYLMPTRPIEIILPSSIESKEFQDLVDLVSSILDELVSFGTQVVHWVGNNPKFRKPDVDVPLVLLSRHIVELVDAISILVKKSSIDPCKVLLRSALESMLYIKFVATEKSEDRCKAYLISYIKNKKNEYLKYKIGSQIHNEFKIKIADDFLIKEGLNPFTKELNELVEIKIKNLDNWISNPIFSETIKEYNRVRKKFNRRPPWYLLYGGAENIERLSILLNYQYLYEAVYRKWSDFVHASDVITGRIASGEEGKSSFFQIRLGNDIIEVAMFTVNITLSAYRQLIEFIVPEMLSNYSAWYIREIREPFLKISRTRVKLT